LKNYSTDKKVIIGIIIGFCLAICGGVLFILSSGNSSTEVGAQGIPVTAPEALELEEQQESQAFFDALWFEGNPHMFNRELTNILLLGVDTRGEVGMDEEAEFAGQADAIILLTLDSRTETVHMLQISRDTMVEVDVVGESGEVIRTFEGQLALQHSYGGGERSSAFAMRRTTSRLLQGLPIHGFITLYIDAIQALNDEIGGVTITLSDDFIYIDPAFAEGETVTLDGSQAERFVQYRDMNNLYGNDNRMIRQTIYFAALFDRLRELVGDTVESYAELYELLEPFMVTDLRVRDIPRFIGYNYGEEEVVFLPGELSREGRYAVFHVDDEVLEEMIINTFYVPIER
jgi:anionic cell wall polymer biosynthesis LytR-Cps2A-Psr (LCP) family protein